MLTTVCELNDDVFVLEVHVEQFARLTNKAVSLHVELVWRQRNEALRFQVRPARHLVQRRDDVGEFDASVKYLTNTNIKLCACTLHVRVRIVV